MEVRVTVFQNERYCIGCGFFFFLSEITFLFYSNIEID